MSEMPIPAEVFEYNYRCVPYEIWHNKLPLKRTRLGRTLVRAQRAMARSWGPGNGRAMAKT